MWLLYDFAFLLFAVLYLPVFLVRRKLHPGFSARLGRLPRGVAFDRPVWVHAVSVGEAASVRHLVEELRQAFPGRQFVFSTVTPTGNSVIAPLAAPGDLVTYLPLDLSFIVRPVLRRVRPSCLVIMETEIWPNLIRQARRQGIPVVVVNARISDSSYGRYRLAAPLLKPVLNSVDAFCCQSERDAARLRAMGLASDRCHVTGNMKFDIKVRDYDELRKDYHDYRNDFGIGPQEKLMVAASTHAGEEEQVMEAFTGLHQDIPGLRLLVAPRHPERADEVAKAVSAAGFSPVKVSQLASRRPAGGAGRSGEVFILDSVGKLMYFYAISDLVFVGGSLVPTGGHNMLEPASLGKPVLCGPHTFNFKDIARLFAGKNAMVVVRDAAALRAAAASILRDPGLASRLAAASRGIINENQGATARNRDMVKKVLAGRAGMIK